jgi:hypothetical protein
MIAAAAVADRARAVRLAARAWQRAGAIDEATRRAIDERYPDDRQRLGPIFRVLVFFFAFISTNMLLGLFAACASGGTEAVLGTSLLMFGAVLVGVTEVLLGPLRRADSGVEAATALMGVGYLAGGCTWVLSSGAHFRHEFEIFLLACVVLATAGAVRWGFAFLAGIATIALFLSLGQMPGGRITWIVLSLALIVPALSLSRSAALTPSHRRCSAVIAALALLALYGAVHIGSWDSRWLEELADASGRYDWPPWLRLFPILATALLPVILIAIGLLRRQVLLINVGLLLGAASAVTLRFYVHVAPVWIVLIGSGAAALGAALAVRRFLASGPRGERGGFTAEPLFEDAMRRHAAELVATIAALAPGARPAAASESSELRPGGGRFGGGGAGGDY